MEITAATTGLDWNYQRLTRQSLEQMAGHAPDRARMLGWEHDMTLPPLGKIVNYRVEERPDGEHQLAATVEQFTRKRRIPLPDGTFGVEEYAPSDPTPFFCPVGDCPDVLQVETDFQNFETPHDHRAFFEAIHEAAECETGGMVRKSIIPDPHVVIALTPKIILAVLGTKVAWRLGGKVVDKLGMRWERMPPPSIGS